MANTALREARVRARLSQTDLARRIRELGFRGGDPNGCTRVMVQRWESGKVQRPQPRYVLALEMILGAPAQNLGFADIELGVDRDRALSEGGLGAPFMIPAPGDYPGERTGIWLSSYDYHSSSRDATFTSKHYVMVMHRGTRLVVYSVPASASRVSMELSVNGQVITGTWAEQTQETGYYQGAPYYGAIQMLLDPTGRRMAGKWVGFGRDMAVSTDAWSLTLVDSGVDEAAVERWNREPDDP
jgi:transcriptional regulator with XRE-family HTH domain